MHNTDNLPCSLDEWNENKMGSNNPVYRIHNQ